MEVMGNLDKRASEGWWGLRLHKSEYKSEWDRRRWRYKDRPINLRDLLYKGIEKWTSPLAEEGEPRWPLMTLLRGFRAADVTDWGLLC